MRRLKLDHWFVGEDTLGISLMRYYVDINITIDDDKIKYILRVIDSDRKELLFDFDALEEAISFVEGVINKCKSYIEVEEAYNKYYAQDKNKTLIK